MDTTFNIPGTTTPEITVKRSPFGNIGVLVDGVPAKRRHSRTLSYDIPLGDGTTTELQLSGQWTGLKATVNGVETPLEPPVPKWVLVLTFLPLGLVAVGGLTGALIGVGGSAINARIARLSIGSPAKIGAMLGVTVVALVAYFGVALTIRNATSPIGSFEAGRCVNGVKAGQEVTADATRPVDCATAHDNEVIGVVPYAGTGAYPGPDALLTFATQPCLDAFASYVGIPLETSELDVIPVLPSDSTWSRGDRQIACVAVTRDGSQFTGSILGARR